MHCELTVDRLAGKPNLESMPMEIQVEIMRHFLKHHGPLELFLQDTYTNQSWGFGSLGILSVSKHFLMFLRAPKGREVFSNRTNGLDETQRSLVTHRA